MPQPKGQPFKHPRVTCEKCGTSIVNFTRDVRRHQSTDKCKQMATLILMEEMGCRIVEEKPEKVKKKLRPKLGKYKQEKTGIGTRCTTCNTYQPEDAFWRNTRLWKSCNTCSVKSKEKYKNGVIKIKSKTPEDQRKYNQDYYLKHKTMLDTKIDYQKHKKVHKELYISVMKNLLDTFS